MDEAMKQEFSAALTTAGIQHEIRDFLWDEEMSEFYLPYERVEIYWEGGDDWPLYVSVNAADGNCDEKGYPSRGEASHIGELRSTIRDMRAWLDSTKPAAEWGFNTYDEEDDLWLNAPPRFRVLEASSAESLEAALNALGSNYKVVSSTATSTIDSLEYTRTDYLVICELVEVQ